MKSRITRFVIYPLCVLLLAGLGIFFGIAPGIAEKSMNQVIPHAISVSEDVKAFHETLLIADLHADSLLWNRNLLKRGTRGHVDLPRLIDGNVALQVFTTVTKTPAGINNLHNETDARDNITLLALAQRWPIATWGNLTARALHQSDKLHGFVAQSRGALTVILDRKSLEMLLQRRASGENIVGAVLGTEGSHALDGDIANVKKLYDAGFRMMSLQHFFDNQLGGSLHGESKAGLTEFGQQVVLEIERLGIMLDVSHSSVQVVRDVLKIARRPLIISHTGIRSHCDTARNLDDELVLQVTTKGGLIGIGYWQSAACDISPEGVATAIKRAIELVGVDHVALGSDFDGAVTTGFDTASLAQLTQALIDVGVDRKSIAKVMGGNQIRFFEKHLPQ